MQERHEHGQSIVEVALVLPLLALLLTGLLDFGRAFFVSVALNDAAAEGAVYAATRPTDTTGITARARGSLEGTPLINQNQVQVTVACAGGNCATVTGGSAITVTTSYPFTFITPLIGNFFGGSITLRARAVSVVMQ